MSVQHGDYTYQISDQDVTDLQLVSVDDASTGFCVRTALCHPTKQAPSVMAFAGARFSRSADSAYDIFAEIHDAGANAQQKLAAIFRKYGHASVADMAQLFGYIENVPQYIATCFFCETSLGGGQERSTRYQDFSGTAIIGLETYVADRSLPGRSEVDTALRNLQSYSLQKNKQYIDTLTSRYISAYQIDETSKSQMGALRARVFDSARAFLLFGLNNRTSLGWITSARERSRIISRAKGHHHAQLCHLGDQLEALFAPDEEIASQLHYVPEAHDLIRYTMADETQGHVLQQLRDQLEARDFFVDAVYIRSRHFVETRATSIRKQLSGMQKALAQTILIMRPHLDLTRLTQTIMQLPDDKATTLGQIMCRDFTHHQQMGQHFRTNCYSYLIEGSIPEIRDLNRHRARARFAPLIASDQFEETLRGSYTLPLYLTANDALSDVREEFEADLRTYYGMMDEFADRVSGYAWFPRWLLPETLPFGHLMRTIMHASPKEIDYMTKLRVRPGGHINYRKLAYDIAAQTKKIDPLMAGLDVVRAPDPTSHEEFVDRS